MDARKDTDASCTYTVVHDPPDHLRLEFSGSLTAQTLSRPWKDCTQQLKKRHLKTLTIDAANVQACDGAGIGLLSRLLHLARDRHIEASVVGLKDDMKGLLDRFLQTSPPTIDFPTVQLSAIELIGRETLTFGQDCYEQIAFFARVLVTGLKLLGQPWTFRWKDFFKIAEYAGVRAVGIVSVLGLLFGLIMAFSSAMPLKQFGVEIYVSDLVAIALVRVLGPFITAIIVAGRTGSAYAAEIGTMKINNEIDALKVMNLDPIAFLVLPRVWATTLMTPLLAIAANILGLIGAAIVILSLGYPLVTYGLHVQSILTVPDVLVGLVKAIVYGGLIGTVGCLRGLQTKIGAGAVGISTTRAVVTSIILLVATEGLFSVLLYFLDI